MWILSSGTSPHVDELGCWISADNARRPVARSLVDNPWSRSRWQDRNASIVSRNSAHCFRILSRATVCQQDIRMMGRNASRDASSWVCVSLLEVCQNKVVRNGQMLRWQCCYQRRQLEALMWKVVLTIS